MQIAMYITTGQPQYCRFVYIIDPQIARFMGPTKSPPRPGRPQMGPMLAHGPCYQGLVSVTGAQSFSWVLSNEQTSLICMFYGTYTPTCLQNGGGGLPRVILRHVCDARDVSKMLKGSELE